MAPVLVYYFGSRYQRVCGTGVAPRTTPSGDGVNRLIGETHPKMSPPNWSDMADNLEIATDVTFKDGRIRAAYTIHSRNRPGTLQSVLPVDGNMKYTTLYQTELFRILGAIIAAHQLLTATNKPWENLSGSLWCDNKAAVNKYNALIDQAPFSLTEANKYDANVQQELRHWKVRLPIVFTARWVRAHQRKLITRNARLNNMVDQLASSQHEKTGCWASRKAGQCLLNTRARLSLGGTPYT